MCDGVDKTVESGIINKLEFEGSAVRNYRVRRRVYRCTECGKYTVGIKRLSKPRYDKFIFPDDKKLKMKERRY